MPIGNDKRKIQSLGKGEPDMNMLNPLKTANIPQSATPAHLSSPTGIPQPRQGRHIPTPGEAQRNPGIQTPQQNKPPKGGDTSSTLPPRRDSGFCPAQPSRSNRDYALPPLMPSFCPLPGGPVPIYSGFCLLPSAFCLMPYALCLMPYISIPTCFTPREIPHKPTPLPTTKIFSQNKPIFKSPLTSFLADVYKKLLL